MQDLVNEFVTSKRGVATLMTYGQSEAGREALMYGEAGSRVNLTPRALPAPHHIQQQRAPGIVPAAFKATLAHVPTLINAVRASPSPSRPSPRQDPSIVPLVPPDDHESSGAL